MIGPVCKQVPGSVWSRGHTKRSFVNLENTYSLIEVYLKGFLFLNNSTLNRFYECLVSQRSKCELKTFDDSLRCKICFRNTTSNKRFELKKIVMQTLKTARLLILTCYASSHLASSQSFESTWDLLGASELAPIDSRILVTQISEKHSSRWTRLSEICHEFSLANRTQSVTFRRASFHHLTITSSVSPGTLSVDSPYQRFDTFYG